MTDSEKYPLNYEALASAFRAEGTDVMFSLLGDGNMHWGAAMVDQGARGVYFRHEHPACAAATIYSNSTGRVGVATVTCGPGLSQLSTALATAAQGRIPLVVFVGESPYNLAFYNQYIDQGPMVTATGAHYIAGHSPVRMLDYVRDAFFIARTERRPVVLGVPYDLQKQSHGRPFKYIPSSEFIPRLSRMMPNNDEIDAAAEVIGKAERVVVIAGRGTVPANAQPECEALADAVGGMLATSLPMRGMFDHHPYGIGIAGGYARAAGRKFLSEADVIVAVGAGLNNFQRDGGKLFEQATIIQIDIHPLGLKHGRKAADMYVRADAKQALLAIIERIPKDRRDPGWRTPEARAEIASVVIDHAKFPPQANVVDPRDAVAAIDAVVPKDWQVVNSSGHCAYYTAQLRGRRPESFNVLRDFGAIGNGLSYAIGVANAHPENTVCLLDGDGSLMMHAQELDTVRRHGLKILMCILNDGAYGSEIHKMRADGINEEGGIFGRGDLANVARGFGVRGRTITSVDQFQSAFREYQAAGGGAELWDIHIADNVTSPVMRHNQISKSH
jgi:thiamine pyrophosphate-dependent acetolactate synthase large subunit-like protein